MTGGDFIDMLRDRIAPRDIATMHGTTRGVDVTLSDGKRLTIERQIVRDLETGDDATAYMDGLL